MPSTELPEKIELVQACLWLLRGIRPMEDHVFNRARIRLGEDEVTPDGVIRSLLFHLVEGRLAASGKLAVVHDGEDPSKLVAVSGIGPLSVPTTCWRFDDVRWSDSAVQITDGWDLPFELTTALELSGDFLAWGNLAFFQPVTIATSDLVAVFPALVAQSESKPTGAQPSINVGGRPIKYDWNTFYASAAAWIHENGVPDKQSEMINAMADWCQKNWGDNVPGETVMKDRVQKFLVQFKKEVGN